MNTLLNLISRFINVVLALAFCTGIAAVSYFWAKETVTLALYEARLHQLNSDYEQLRQGYNQAVQQTAVTLLHVENSQVSVIIRTADGSERRIATPFGTDRELYVDFIVSGGRLWIRRVFDARTPPEQGVVIDPLWATVDWQDPQTRHGKAIYRQLTPGRWEIRVSGNGSLNLEPVDPASLPLLAHAPQVAAFAEWHAALELSSAQLGWRDVWAWLRPRLHK